jgi:hypothetical protein
MLQSTFLIAAQLKLIPEHHAALIEVLRRQESGELEHRRFVLPRMPEDGDFRAGLPLGEWFNMGVMTYNVGGAYPDCGSARCYQGWVEAISGIESNMSLYPRGHEIWGLFYPGKGQTGLTSYNDIDCDWAARTLRRYLTTGKVDWAAT